jgi:CheY-like chemotaxis protein
MPSQELRGEALLVLDSGLRVCAANRSFYELFRLAPEECIGRKVYEVGGKSWDGQLRVMLESVLVSGSRSEQFELIHDVDAPGHGALWLTAKMLPASKPGEENILLSIENLTAGRTAEDSLAAARLDLKTFAELASRSAHELNNMLTVMRMNAELLQPELARQGAPVQEVLDIISAAERAEGLTRQLLVSSRRAFPQPTGLDRFQDSEQLLAPSQFEASGSQASAIHQAEERLGGRTILLVEDEKALRSLSKRILNEAGYRVLEAADGAKALRVAADEVGEIDLVLTDVEMPTLGGRGMVAELHELSPGIKVLFMSGYTDNEILRRGITSSQTHFLQKPFTAGGLREAVQAALSQPAMVSS